MSHGILFSGHFDLKSHLLYLDNFGELQQSEVFSNRHEFFFERVWRWFSRGAQTNTTCLADIVDKVKAIIEKVDLSSLPGEKLGILYRNLLLIEACVVSHNQKWEKCCRIRHVTFYCDSLKWEIKGVSRELSRL